MFSTLNPRQILIAVTTFLGGFYFFLEYVLPRTSGVGNYHDQITTGVQVVGSMAVGLGIINILKVHGSKIIRTRSGWVNSLALLLGMFVTLGVEVADLVDSQQSAHRRKEFDLLVAYTKKVLTSYENDSVSVANTQIAAMQSKLTQLGDGLTEKGTDSEIIAARSKLLRAIGSSSEKLTLLGATTTTEEARVEQKHLEESLLSAATLAQELASAERKLSPIKKTQEFLQQGLVESLGSAMFALLAFYIANAAYRAFRIRSLEAVVMMSAALIVMLGQIPFGPLYVSDKLPAWRLWLIETISTPAFRAIYFGAAIAGLSMAVRMWLSLEKSPLTADSGQLGKGDQKK